MAKKEWGRVKIAGFTIVLFLNPNFTHVFPTKKMVIASQWLTWTVETIKIRWNYLDFKPNDTTSEFKKNTSELNQWVLFITFHYLMVYLYYTLIAFDVIHRDSRPVLTGCWTPHLPGKPGRSSCGWAAQWHHWPLCQGAPSHHQHSMWVAKRFFGSMCWLQAIWLDQCDGFFLDKLGVRSLWWSSVVHTSTWAGSLPLPLTFPLSSFPCEVSTGASAQSTWRFSTSNPMTSIWQCP